MKILIISGFLGSGKTTFIKEMVKKTNKNFVIVENEFGELDLDGKLLNSELNTNKKDDEIKIWELTEGCICCSLNIDFTHSVLTIANTLDPEYLIVEPSGVAQLSNIIDKLSKICYENIQLLSPIVVVDAVNFKNMRDEYSTYFLDQLNNSSTIVLSKSENLSEEEFLQIKENICDDKKNQRFYLEHYTKWEKPIWDELFNNEYLIKKDINGRLDIIFNKKVVNDEETLENISFTDFNIESIPHLIKKLYLIMTKAFGSIVRAKGYFNIGDNWFKFDLVDNTYSITGTEPMEDRRLVFIGKNLNKSAIEKFIND